MNKLKTGTTGAIHSWWERKREAKLAGTGKMHGKWNLGKL